MKQLIWFLPAIAVFLGILLLSTVFSAPVQVDGANVSDKLLHAFAYSVFLLTVGFGLIQSKLYTLKRMLICSLLIIAYGTSLEWVQYTFFPDRYFEWQDALANTVGVVTGQLLIIVYRAVF